MSGADELRGALLTDRWKPLRYHPVQAQLWSSRARFRVVAAGRRSGKTELAKRFLVLRATRCSHGDGRFFAAAPTREQAKELYWADLKAMVPRWAMLGEPNESSLTIRLVNGSRIVVIGLDKPQRMEGRPWDGGIVDEVDDVKPSAWQENIRPALADRQGWCWFIGVPNGRGMLYRLFKRGRAGVDQEGGRWEAFTWVSADILPASEIESLREEMDEELFSREMEASFVAFRGRAYKAFQESTHCADLFRLYDPRRPLVFCLDFNVEPGSAVVLQEVARLPNGLAGTAVIGEVHIPLDSTTEAVCRRLVRDWAGHQGPVLVYGDPAGGARHTSQGGRGTDWDVVRKYLRGEFSMVQVRVDKADPGQRARINATNARLRAKSGAIRLMVDARQAPETVLDLEGVKLLEGGSGEINKRGDLARTHWTDGLGYYLARRFPVASGAAGSRARVRHGGGRSAA